MSNPENRVEIGKRNAACVQCTIRTKTITGQKNYSLYVISFWAPGHHRSSISTPFSTLGPKGPRTLLWGEWRITMQGRGKSCTLLGSPAKSCRVAPSQGNFPRKWGLWRKGALRDLKSKHWFPRARYLVWFSSPCDPRFSLRRCREMAILRGFASKWQFTIFLASRGRIAGHSAGRTLGLS